MPPERSRRVKHNMVPQAPARAAAAGLQRHSKEDLEKLVDELLDSGRSRTWIIHFFGHDAPLPPTNIALRKERQDCHFCQLKSWTINDTFPVGIVNKVDNASIDAEFKFVQENEPRDGVEFADEHFLSGCDCTEGAGCQMETCGCLQDLELPDEYEEGEDANPYITDGRREGCLRDWMLNSRRPIYECHDLCKCGEDCPNRVVGRGRKVALQVFRTDDGRGWGLQATDDIKKGQFVGKYVGEILSPEEAQERRQESKASDKKDIYLFALDKFYDPNSSDPRLRREPYEIDGEFMSGPTRFINHSCDPNLRVFAVVTDHANKPVHDLCFFALKEIDRFTELTFDYVDGVDGIKNSGKKGRPSRKDMLEKEDETWTECLCGAKNCRKFLW